VIPASPLLKITLGEDPRAISKPNVSPDPASKPTEAANGTLASAAVDVARIELLTGNPATVDLRVGHMEASAQVPAGGIHCPIPVTKDVNPNKIHIQSSPDTARVTFNVLNPYDCDLTDVVLTDAIRQKVGDPDFKLITANPAAESPTMPTGALRTADVVWKLGTIPSGGKKVVTMDVKSAVHGGVLRDVGTASGVLKNCKGGADAGLAVAGLDISNLTLTGVSPVAEIAIELARTGPDTRRTTAVGAGIAALGVGAAFTLRRRRRV
jgi:LPXTG-motif cell wall-anchored protein